MVDYSIFKGCGVPVTLTKPDSFNIIRESLTRIGVAAKNEKILYQSAHILHKQGLYVVLHFKELFILDGKPSTLVDNDIHRRNTIAKLLQQWELLTIVGTEDLPVAPLSEIKILTHKEKADWTLCAKYTIGAKKTT